MANLLSESIANRLSTQMLQQRGAQRKIVVENGKLVNTYSGGSGREHFSLPGSVLSTKGSTFPASVNPEQFYIIRAHYQKRGSSKLAAETMALLLIDTARVLSVSPMSLLDESSSGKMTLALGAYSTMNSLRVPSDQQGVVETAVHKKTAKALAIRA